MRMEKRQKPEHEKCCKAAAAVLPMTAPKKLLFTPHKTVPSSLGNRLEESQRVFLVVSLILLATLLAE